MAPAHVLPVATLYVHRMWTACSSQHSMDSTLPQVSPQRECVATSQALSFYKSGSWVSGRWGICSRSQSCSVVELQLEMTFTDLKVTVVSVTPSPTLWENVVFVWAAFLVFLYAVFVSLSDPCPDCLLWTQCVRPLSPPSSTHNADYGSSEGWNTALLPGFAGFTLIFNSGD